MKNDRSQLPPFLRNFSSILILISITGGILLCYILFKENNFEKNINFFIFIIISTIVHLFVGVSILSKRLWGFFTFKLYLYLMLLAIPIGTYISKKTLEYIEKNNIKDLYT